MEVDSLPDRFLYRDGTVVNRTGGGSADAALKHRTSNTAIDVVQHSALSLEDQSGGDNNIIIRHEESPANGGENFYQHELALTLSADERTNFAGSDALFTPGMMIRPSTEIRIDVSAADDFDMEIDVIFARYHLGDFARKIR